MAPAAGEIAAVEAALREASVRIQEEIARHIGFTGDAIDVFVKHKSASGADARHAAMSKDNKINKSGDKVLALDELADQHVEESLIKCDLVAGFASEERDDFVELNPNGKYIVVFDPIDGSQNVAINISVGAIYGIFEAKHLDEVKVGDEIVAAGYAVFSSALQFCFCSRTEPVSFSQYDPITKDWVVFIEDHQRPRKAKHYAINEGSCANWDPIISTFVAQHLRGRSVRWMSCCAADFHRQLLQGGCFLYPADSKYPNGRLRLVYEAIPLAFIWERAGKGAAYTTVQCERILERPIPKDVHVRCGMIFLGEAEAEAFHKVTKTAPTWLGGTEQAKLDRKQQAETTAAKGEVSLLRVALIAGAVFNIVLLIRNAR